MNISYTALNGYSCRMLNTVSQDLAFRIMDCLSTKERLKLSSVCKAWQEICHANHSWRTITFSPSLDQLQEAQNWLADLDERSNTTVKHFRLDVQCHEEIMMPIPEGISNGIPLGEIVFPWVRSWHQCLDDEINLTMASESDTIASVSVLWKSYDPLQASPI